MVSTSTQKPLKVIAGGTAGSYVIVPLEQLDQVRKVLQANAIPHWVDHYAISIDGRPPSVVIDLDRKAEPDRVQALLDAA